MYKKTAYNRQELNKIIEALDQLGKYYTIHKRIQSTKVNALDECGIPREHSAGTYVWYVTEVEPQSGAPSAVGDIKVKVDMDTSGIETALEEVRELLTRPLSDFITIQVGEDSAS